MQESRLFQILYYLLDRGSATATELAERCQVSVRTIYRDVDALSRAGIPVYAETGRNGGIRVLEHFTVDRAILSEEERLQIMASLKSLAAVGQGCEQDTLSKLAAVFAVPGEDWYEVDFSRWGEGRRDNEKFETLKSAVIHHKVVEIAYVSSDGKESLRKIQPLKLAYRSREWYLKAWCMERKDFRIFKLNRILRMTCTEQSFTPRHFPEFPQADSAGCEGITLRFPREMAYRVYDEFDPEAVERMENGDLLVQNVDMPQDAWLTGYLLSFGTSVEILHPAHLRETVARQARAIWEKYGDSGKSPEGSLQNTIEGAG